MSSGCKLACFDMDGTIIRNIDSVRFLCELSGMGAQHTAIQRLEDAGLVSWVEADFMKAPLIKGLPVDEIERQLDEKVLLISGIRAVIGELAQRGIYSILLTSGPIQVASAVGAKCGFEMVFGSGYEVLDGRFTGRIIKHLGENGKLDVLRAYCDSKGIELQDCVAIGDGSTDVDVFKNVGKAIAINYSEVLIGHASIYLTTEDMRDILAYIG